MTNEYFTACCFGARYKESVRSLAFGHAMQSSDKSDGAERSSDLAFY